MNHRRSLVSKPEQGSVHRESQLSRAVLGSPLQVRRTKILSESGMSWEMRHLVSPAQLWTIHLDRKVLSFHQLLNAKLQWLHDGLYLQKDGRISQGIQGMEKHFCFSVSFAWVQSKSNQAPCWVIYHKTSYAICIQRFVFHYGSFSQSISQMKRSWDFLAWNAKWFFKTCWRFFHTKNSCCTMQLQICARAYSLMICSSYLWSSYQLIH